ncbi:MAG: VWA domain-containing protein [Acidimicrobiales bacterium]
MTLALTEAQRSLGLFAESLAGQVVRIEAREDDRRGWPWDLGLPDPLVVSLAPVMDIGSTDEAQRRVYRLQVLHQLSLAEFGTFGNDHDHLDRHAAPRHPLIVDSDVAEAAAAIVVLLEHLRVTEAVRAFYPGARHDLDDLLALALAEAENDSVAAGEHDVADALRRCCLGGTALAGAPATTSLDPVLLATIDAHIDPLRSPAATLDDSAATAVELATLLLSPSAPTRPSDGEPFVPRVDDPDEADAEIEFPDLEGISTSPPPLDAEADRTSDDLEGSIQSSPITIAAELEALERSTAAEPRRPPRANRRGVDPDDRTFVYDEWNHLERSYERSWCRVIERRLVGEDSGFIDEVRDRHAHLGRQIRRQFAMLRPEERVRVYRRDDGDELDLDAVIEAIVDRRSGAAADDRLNIRRDRAVREVATAFLVDLSASTSSPAEEVPPPLFDEDDDDPFDDPFKPRPVAYDETPVRRVIDVAKDAVALMCDALGQLGDRHAVYGFSGQSRHEVEFRVGKEFDDRTAGSTWAGIGAMQPLSYTRMGPAIRHAASKLAKQEARTKLLIVISDGYPQDIDYGPDRRDKTYGLHDTAKAIEEAAQLGVDTFCVTIDPAGHDYLRVMSPEHRYLVIDDVESLPAELAKLYLSLAGPTARHSSPVPTTD